MHIVTGPNGEAYACNCEIGRDHSTQTVLWNSDPECVHELVSGPGGGIVCSKCRGWFCY